MADYVDPRTKRLSTRAAKEFTEAMREHSNDELKEMVTTFSLMDHDPFHWDHEMHKIDLICDVMNKRLHTRILNPYRYRTIKIVRYDGSDHR